MGQVAPQSARERLVTSPSWKWFQSEYSSWLEIFWPVLETEKAVFARKFSSMSFLQALEASEAPGASSEVLPKPRS